MFFNVFLFYLKGYSETLIAKFKMIEVRIRIIIISDIVNTITRVRISKTKSIRKNF